MDSKYMRDLIMYHGSKGELEEPINPRDKVEKKANKIKEILEERLQAEVTIKDTFDMTAYYEISFYRTQYIFKYIISAHDMLDDYADPKLLAHKIIGEAINTYVNNYLLSFQK